MPFVGITAFVARLSDLRVRAERRRAMKSGFGSRARGGRSLLFLPNDTGLAAPWACSPSDPASVQQQMPEAKRKTNLATMRIGTTETKPMITRLFVLLLGMSSSSREFDRRPSRDRSRITHRTLRVAEGQPPQRPTRNQPFEMPNFSRENERLTSSSRRLGRNVSRGAPASRASNRAGPPAL